MPSNWPLRISARFSLCGAVAARRDSLYGGIDWTLDPRRWAFVRRFVERHLDRLAAVPNGFFAVNLVARKEGKNTPETNVYTRHYLEKTSWRPDICSVFAGALLYPRYNFLERAILRLLMSYTGGPTDPTKEYVFTDWEKVEAFAKEAAALTAKRG